jgi:hypothetical protein
MSYCRYPYYIYKNGDKINVSKIDELQGYVDDKAFGQFFVNLITKPAECVSFIKQGLVCEREAHKFYRDNDVIEPGDRPMTKTEVVCNLYGIIDHLQLEIDKQSRDNKSRRSKG